MHVFSTSKKVQKPEKGDECQDDRLLVLMTARSEQRAQTVHVMKYVFVPIKVLDDTWRYVKRRL